MKVLYVGFLCLFVNYVATAQSLDLKTIRQDFNKGIKDEELCEKHLGDLNKHASTAVERGYAAAYTMFMAKHTGNPLKKMSYFKDGKKRLEQQVKQNPSNVELRFIRLCIQYHIPKYLGYSGEIEEDKKYVLEHLPKIKDDTTRTLLFKYLKGANIYSDQEIAMFKR